MTETQKKILRVLAAVEQHGCISRATLCQKAGIHLPQTRKSLGCADPVKRGRNDARFGLSLLSLGYVEAEVMDVDGLMEANYRITPTGLHAIERLDLTKYRQ